MKYKVSEIFVSINGEGLKAGELSVFVRLYGCNLRCKYCDSKYTYENNDYTEMTGEEILQAIRGAGIENVTLTGGEPLIHNGIVDLVEDIGAAGYDVEIETNGSVDISAVTAITHRPRITLDYKTSASGEENKNLLTNFGFLEYGDCLKFVVGSIADMEKAVQIVKEHGLLYATDIIFSPVFGMINPADMVGFMRKHRLNGYKMQLQMHKVIWPPDKRGV